MHYSLDLVNHIRTVKDCADRLEFEADVNVRNFALEISKGDLKVRFQPRFLFVDASNGQRNITYYARPDARGFVGWLPYFNKVWPVAQDKVAFKTSCRERGLRTPDWWTKAPAGLSDFLIKRMSGSLGVGMRGPYRALDGANPYHQLAEGEYYERFVEGRIAKIWYWNSHPVCLELLGFPQLTGDGRRSIREMIETRLELTSGTITHTVSMSRFEPIVSYYGRTLDTVLAAGEKIYGSFRYASILETTTIRNRNALATLNDPALAQNLAAIGRSLWETIPEDIRLGVLYSVDAVLDAKGELWLLEMNPNPGVHPDCYPAMIASVLNKAVSRMPSVSKPSPDAAYLKGGLVWAPSAAIRRSAETDLGMTRP